MQENAAPPSAGENFDRLKALLREMFQLDRGDLDFGLYRIMNVKAAEIGAFLDRDLLPQVERTLRLAGAEKDADAEADVYDRLAAFFARYYTEGDFVSQRRYVSGGRSAYLIPYDGEEVKLHWANADQYYVKTTENYASYVFHVGTGAAAWRVRFEIAAADAEKDNVKEADGRQRRFVLAAGKSAVAVDGGALTARFEHRPLTAAEKRRWPGSGGAQQRRVNEAAAERILKAVGPEWRAPLAALAPTEADPGRTVLARHVERYTAKNDFDYFIHKDLGGFLRRELDLYLNAEVLNLDDLEQGDAARLDRALARARAIRHVGRKIVDFLAQLEEFQKRLWLKKKFVLETNWCVTLDRTPEALYPEIAANAAQQAEWSALFAADEILRDASGAATGLFERGAPPPVPVADAPPDVDVEFLKANPYLVVDTRHFDRGFADRLLEALSDAGPLDDRTDGLLVHGENFQALNLLQARYRGQVQCVYIDPPYNTDASAILYKNNYKDSSWLSFMENGILLARNYLQNEGILCVAIDDEEVSLLRLVLQRVFEKELGIVPVRSNPAGRKSRGQFSPSHEYALFFGNAAAVPGSLDKTENELARYPFADKEGRYAWNNLIRHGSGDRRQDRPTMFYPIYIDRDDTLRVPEMEYDSDKQEYNVLEDPKEGECVIWPIVVEDGSRIEKRWHRGPDRVASKPSDYRVRRAKEGGNGNNGISIDFKIRIDMNSMPKTWWDDKKYASANLGAKALKDFFGETSFDFAKSTGLVEDCLRASRCDSQSLVLDYFGGSGTTGHAVVNLNREDDGGRKYILVEMGHHFDTVLLPRMKKIVHSPDWKGGKPVSRAGVSQAFKYVRLESWDDTMDNLEVAPRSAEQEELLAANADFAEDYRLRYVLEAETAGSVCLLGRHFTDPFAYTLATVRDGARRETPVDLPETFNWLIGLRMASRRRIDGVLAITGTDAKGRGCLILWRNLDRMDAESLNAWFARNRPRLPDSLDLVYVNGDHTLNGVKRPDDPWTAETLEPRFRELMFETAPR